MKNLLKLIERNNKESFFTFQKEEMTKNEDIILKPLKMHS
jgi:hypothetical protein